MKNLFDANAYHEIVERINKLTPNSERLWGKMTVSQMLAHVSISFGVPLSDKPLPRMLLGRLLGWTMKAKLYNDEPWKRNLPTSPEFIIKEDKQFDAEKEKLLKLVDRFHHHGKETAGRFPHPFFGSFTTEQWGMSMYKHLDHHLQQFGV